MATFYSSQTRVDFYKGLIVPTPKTPGHMLSERMGHEPSWEGAPAGYELMPAISWWFDRNAVRLTTLHKFPDEPGYYIEFEDHTSEMVGQTEIEEMLRDYRKKGRPGLYASPPKQRDSSWEEQSMAKRAYESEYLTKEIELEKARLATENDRLDAIVKTAVEQEAELARLKPFRETVRTLLRLTPAKWMTWGTAELDVLRSFPGKHSEIIEAYAALEPVKLSERCRAASGKQRGWLAKLFTPDEAAYYENQVRPLQPKLQNLLEQIGPLIERFHPNHEALAMAVLALQAMLKHVENERDRTIGYQRLGVLTLARTTNGMLEQSMENTRTLIASSLAGLDELLEITIPNWGMAATNAKVQTLVDNTMINDEPLGSRVEFKAGKKGGLSITVKRPRPGLVDAEQTLADLAALQDYDRNKSVDTRNAMPQRPAEYIRT